jgi:hypothetical protein
MAAGCCGEEDDDLLLRRLIPCEEDRRRLFPAMKYTGGYRWFRSPNVIDLEARRKARAGDGRLSITHNFPVR